MLMRLSADLLIRVLPLRLHELRNIDVKLRAHSISLLLFQRVLHVFSIPIQFIFTVQFAK